MEEIDVPFGKHSTDEENIKLLQEEIKKIQYNGYRIIGAEPIEQAIARVVGRRFIVERIQA